MEEQSISLNKFISQTGLCSRRAADKLIEQGRVLLNGKIAKKGNRVTLDDDVIVDGQVLRESKDKTIVIALHKPAGITSTTDQRDADNIIDFINFPKRIFPIGRLDKASTGLILLTNNGDLVNPLLRQENNHEKEYIVSVDKPITNDFIKQMRHGVPILGTKTKACQVTQLKARVFKIILTQGLNRQIRRMAEYLGYNVLTIKRIRFHEIELGQLRPGQWRQLSQHEVGVLTQSMK